MYATSNNDTAIAANHLFKAERFTYDNEKNTRDEIYIAENIVNIFIIVNSENLGFIKSINNL